MIFRQLIDKESSTYTYLLADPDSKEALLIDPVREQFQRDHQLIAELGLTLRYTLETHMHADHVTASGLFRQKLRSESVVSINAGADCASRHVQSGDKLQLGEIVLLVIETPGHTNGCISFYLPAQGMVFTGDALLIRGCGRTDFQQGSAGRLYDSIHHNIFKLPEETLIYPGHDYHGRTVTSVGEEKLHNPRLGGGKSKIEFKSIMQGLKLGYPRKMDEAVPANLQCGLPTAQVDSDFEPQLSPNAVDSWAPIHRRNGVPEVSKAWVKENESRLQVVDVREQSEYLELPPISTAICIPLAHLADQLKQLTKGKGTVLVCKSGRRSARACDLLAQHGFEHVASMTGGMLSWHQQSGSCG